MHQSRKLNRNEKKVLRGVIVKLIKFIAGLDQAEISLVCRIIMSKLNQMDVITVDTDDDD